MQDYCILNLDSCMLKAAIANVRAALAGFYILLLCILGATSFKDKTLYSDAS